MPRQWFDDDSFWRAFLPFMFSESRWEAAAHDAGPVADLLGVKPGARILDLGCGPGRFSMELAERGFDVTGVDRTRPYLALARSLTRKRRLRVRYVLSDMRRFVEPGAFDGAINMFTTFGYFEKKSDDLKVARNVRRSLRPGGRFLVQAGGKEWLTRVFQPRDWSETDGAFVLEERKPAPDWSGLHNRWILIKKGRAREFRFFLRVYSGVELRELLLQAGFRKVELFGDLDRRRYDHEARWLTALAHK
jgi:SAM-dependent methyltransferase